jgi:hypothetical protein
MSDVTDPPKGRARGGHARAEALSPQDRTQIARRAALARWGDGTPPGDLPRETHSGILVIGDLEIPCAVLENGQRVFSARGLSRAIGSRTKSIKVRPGQEDVYADARQMPPFLAAPAIRPFIPNDLLLPVTNPIQYRIKRGGGTAFGYEASLLPKICGVILDAAKEGVFRKSQRQLVERAELLIRGLAHVGVIALVDEATGYQSDRDKDALQEILNLYIGQELAKWAKRFPDAFYEQMFRLKGWHFNPNSSQRPHAMARLTLDLVFDRIGPGLSNELKQRRKELLETTGRRRAKLHQAMTVDIGHPALQHHLSGLTFLGKSFADGDWNGFYAAVERVTPRYNRTLPLPLEPPDGHVEGNEGVEAITGEIVT